MTILENGTMSAICLAKRFIFLLHFTSAFPKKSDGFPRLMYLYFCWEFLTEVEILMENFDLSLLKWFQKSLILKASKVETSSLTLFYSCVTCHQVGMNEVEICQLFVVSEIVNNKKYSMWTAKPLKLSVFRHIAFNKVLLSKYTLSVKVRLRYPNRTRPSVNKINA